MGQYRVNDNPYHAPQFNRPKKTFVRDAEEKILPYVNNDQSLKDSLLISKALIDHHLPFLPLERNHVRRCIKNAIQVNLYNS